MTKPFPSALKQTMVARLTGVNAISAAQLARETGVSQQNLSRWLAEARRSPFGVAGGGVVSSWSVEQKSQIIAHAATLAGDELHRYLETGEQSVGTAKRIAKLERELIRKNRALAEAATLLWLREGVESPTQKEHDWFDEQPDELEVDSNVN